MPENSFPWSTGSPGTGDGASPFAQHQLAAWLRDTYITDQYASEGILAGVGGNMAVTGTTSPVSVAAGAAYVYGFYYQNTSSISLTIPTATVGTTGHRVILRADWLLRNVRVALLSSADGTSTIPAITQSAPTVFTITAATNATPIAITTSASHGWTTGNQIEIANVLGNTAANGTWTITVTGATTATLDTSVGNGVYTSSGVATKLTGSKWDISLCSLTRTTGGTITITDLREYAHPDQALVIRRQGGNAANWSISGSTTYTPGACRMQVGAASVTFSASATSALTTVTFPVTFSEVPVVIVSLHNAGSSSARKAHITIESISTTQVTLRGASTDNSSISGTWDMYWLALGAR